jgi:toxin-antitoxin system PIN domain toxin
VILPDVNVLLYAFRADSPAHAAYRQWVETLVNAPAAYGMAPQVLASVIRISTHPRIYVQPSTLDEAIEFCRILLTPNTCTVLHPGDRHWDIFLDLCAKSRATGNLIQDAWFAALAIESGCEWVTTDRDYSRFPGLRWRTPL